MRGYGAARPGAGPAPACAGWRSAASSVGSGTTAPSPAAPPSLADSRKTPRSSRPSLFLAEPHTPPSVSPHILASDTDAAAWGLAHHWDDQDRVHKPDGRTPRARRSEDSWRRSRRCNWSSRGTREGPDSRRPCWTSCRLRASAVCSFWSCPARLGPVGSSLNQLARSSAAHGSYPLWGSAVAGGMWTWAWLLLDDFLLLSVPPGMDDIDYL